MKFAALLGTLLCFAAPVWADDDAPLPNNQTMVTLSASDQKNVQQDQLNASLRIEIDDRDARKVQDKINKAMQAAVAVLKTYPAVKFSTGQYYVYSYDPNPSPRPLSHAEQAKRMVWKGSQTLDFYSGDAQSVLDAVAKIQDTGFAMNGLNYVLSEKLAEEQKDILLSGAIAKIQKKAELVVKALGKKSYDITELNVDGSYMPSPQPMMMKAMGAEMAVASDAVATPVAAPGESQVSLNVSARIAVK